MKELWKDIKGYEGLYQISNFGKVYSKIGNLRYKNPHPIMMKYDSSGGYARVMLSKDKVFKRFLVHRLVAEAFIPNPLNKPEVNHIDGNKLNNCVDNLEWVTCKENKRHAIKNGLWQGKGKSVVQYKNGIEIARYKSVREASLQTGISARRIYEIAEHQKHRYTIKGYGWKYEKEVISNG